MLWSNPAQLGAQEPDAILIYQGAEPGESSVAVDSSGVIYVAFHAVTSHWFLSGAGTGGPETGMILLARSDDGGANFDITTVAGGGIFPARRPSLALGPNGEVYVTYVQGSLFFSPGCPCDQNNWDSIKIARSTDGGSSFTHTLQMSTPDVLIDAEGGDVAVDFQGNVYVVWTEQRSLDETFKVSPETLMMSVSKDGGETYSSPADIYTGEFWTQPSGRHGYQDQYSPKIEVSNDDVAHIVWTSGTNTGFDLLYRETSIHDFVDVQSLLFTTPFVIDDDVLFASRSTDIAVDLAGELSLIYATEVPPDFNSRRILHARIVEGRLVSRKQIARVSQPNFLWGHQAVSVNDLDEVWVAWAGPRVSPDSRHDIFRRMSFNAGAGFTGQSNLSDSLETTSFHPSLAVNNSGEPLLVWSEVDPDSNVFNAKGSLYLRTKPPKPRIHSVEFTQAIQELQSLEVMLKDLLNAPLLPVPMVAGKPAVMRVYLDSLEDSADVTVEVSDQLAGSQEVSLGAFCSPELRRRAEQGCISADFYFTPPEGAWTAVLKLKDQDGIELESHDIVQVSKKTIPLTIVPVTVCDAVVAGTPQCTSTGDIQSLLPFVRAIFPIPNINLQNQNLGLSIVHRGTFEILPGSRRWWGGVLNEVQSLRTVNGGSGSQSHWYGLVRSSVPGRILGIGYPPDGTAAQPVSKWASGAGKLSPQGDDTLAHEVAHNRTLEHAPCGGPDDIDPNWPNGTNPSAELFEVGFDVAKKTTVLPDAPVIRDLLSYCPPKWVTTYTYNGLLSAFETPGLTTTLSAPASVQDSVSSSWQVSGTIENGVALLSPLFQVDAVSEPDSGAGSYRIEIRGASGDPLVTRTFEPLSSHWQDVESEPFFSELIPVTEGAASIVVLDDANQEIGNIIFGGSAPTVEFTFPTGGETLSGLQTLAWTVDDIDPDDSHSYRLEYSSDGGTTFSALSGTFADNSLKVDFDGLPGSSGQAILQLLVTDGVNTTVAASELFTVPSKGPQAWITFPAAFTSSVEGELVWLQAFAFDVDDGFLSSGSVQWESDQDGALGAGADLPVTGLTPGIHVITLTTTDADGNEAFDSVLIGVELRELVAEPPHTTGISTVSVEITGDGNVKSSPSGIDCPGDCTEPYDGDMVVNLLAKESPAARFKGWGGDCAAAGTSLTCVLDGNSLDKSVTAEFEVNTPPVADAGNNTSVDENSLLFLKGTGSSDAEGDTLTCLWTQVAGPAISLSNPFGCSPSFAAPSVDVDTLVTIELVVNDGLAGSLTDAVDVTISNVPFLFAFGSAGDGDGEFNSPLGITMDMSDNVYVADTKNNRVQKFDSLGNHVMTFGSVGSGDGQFKDPIDLAVDDDGNIYVADIGNSRIQKFDSSGNFILKFGSQGNGDGQFGFFNGGGPSGVAVDNSGIVYAVDAGNIGGSRIQVFASDGAFISKFHLSGTGVTRPFRIVVDTDANIYVSYTDAVFAGARKYDSSGNLLLEFGAAGEDAGEFFAPRGLDLDASGNLYVMGGSLGRLTVFTPSGDLLRSFGTPGTEDGKFNGPNDVAVGSDGDMYVADTLSHRVQVFGDRSLPVADAGGPYSGIEGEPLTLDGSASSDANGIIVLYEWDLDDDGEYDDGTGIELDTVFSTPGEFVVGLRVTNDEGASDTDQANVVISQQPQVGDCNGDDLVNAADITAVVLEIFDGDGEDPADVGSGSFLGTTECESNKDGMINAADITCVVLIIFNGPEGCRPAPDVVLFSISPRDDQLRVVDPDTGETLSSVTIALAGETITGGTGLATNPLTGELWALLKIDGRSGRELVIFNSSPGVATGVGNTGDKFAGLTFDTDGTLYGVTGDGAQMYETLFTLSLTDAVSTLVLALDHDYDGEAIAFNPIDGLIYHASGFSCHEIFESIDPDTLEVDVIFDSVCIDYEEATALVHLEGDVLLLADVDNPLFQITTGGEVTLIGEMDHTSKGLAFAPVR